MVEGEKVGDRLNSRMWNISTRKPEVLDRSEGKQKPPISRSSDKRTIVQRTENS